MNSGTVIMLKKVKIFDLSEQAAENVTACPSSSTIHPSSINRELSTSSSSVQGEFMHSYQVGVDCADVPCHAPLNWSGVWSFKQSRAETSESHPPVTLSFFAMATVQPSDEFSSWLNSTDLRSSPPAEDSSPESHPSDAPDGSDPTGIASVNSSQHASVDDAALPARLVPAKCRGHSQLQYLDIQAAAKRLKPEGKELLRKWIQANDDERDVMNAAMLISIYQHMTATANMSETNLEIPERVQKIVQQKRWGLPANIHEEEDGKWEKIVAYAQKRFTSQKSEIKKMLEASCDAERADHIITVCNELRKIGKKTVQTDITVTSQLCARVAFLYQAHELFPAFNTGGHPKNAKFWSITDKRLAQMCKKAQFDPAKLTHKVLDKDTASFPGQNVNADALTSARPSVSQKEVDEVLRTGDFGNMVEAPAENHTLPDEESDDE
ncbi:hypothetical protein A0H81_11401 [Grifola frondosa]|uniref:Uncharacterized protein n=1 Tax=Grifola frondosa TaxID=5627 RepID=A0A1C7LVP7_GRIFR|nr:hypothetical protein A0H81_11401 [Grifola frondosa]